LFLQNPKNWFFMTKTTATHLEEHSPQERPLWLQIVLVSSIASIAMISMLPFLGIAKLLGVDMSKLSGVQFQFQPVPVLFFFGYGATVVLVIALAQKYLHRHSLNDLGFRPGFLIPIIAGTIFGIAIKAVWLAMLLLSADEYSFSNIVPTDLSLIRYVLHYVYFLIGFITLNSFIEEFALRAYPFENLRKRIHPVILAFASSLVFTVGHFFANEFSIPYSLALMSAGLLYSCVYFQTGSIWAIVGVHNGANWFTFTFFGSSWKIGHIYETTISGTPQWIAEYSSCIAYLLAIGVSITLSRLGVISYFFGITKIELSSGDSHQAS
jgi:membrane protease YdiL (CAAX protease family)